MGIRHDLGSGFESMSIVVRWKASTRKLTLVLPLALKMFTNGVGAINHWLIFLVDGISVAVRGIRGIRRGLWARHCAMPQSYHTKLATRCNEFSEPMKRAVPPHLELMARENSALRLRTSGYHCVHCLRGGDIDLDFGGIRYESETP